MKSGFISGAIAGVIAGIVAAIVALISTIIFVFIMKVLPYIGAPEIWIPSMQTLFAIVSFLLNMIWGGILGILYVVLYNSIPGKGIKKGLIYGWIIFLISNVRAFSFLMPFAIFDFGLTWTAIGFFVLTTYGLVLGYLYKPKK